MAMAGHYWKWLVLSGLVGGAVLGPQRYYQLHYESLVRDPERELKRLCAWLNVDFHPAMLNYYRTESAHNYAKAGPTAQWLARPLDPARLTRWKEQMPARDQRSIIRQAGGLLSHLGYDTGPLGPGAERELESIGRILSPQFVAGLRGAGGPGPGRTGPSALGVRIDRRLQYADFMLGRLEPWAERSTRWQRDVAEMLR